MQLSTTDENTPGGLAHKQGQSETCRLDLSENDSARQLNAIFGCSSVYRKGVFKDHRIQIFRIQRPFHSSRDGRLPFRKFGQPVFYLSVIASL